MQFERAHRRSSRPLGRSCICMSGLTPWASGTDSRKPSGRMRRTRCRPCCARIHNGMIAPPPSFGTATSVPPIATGSRRHRPQALRAPETWRCRIKSRGEDKRFLDLVRYTFARYRVPPHLENVWIDDFDDDFVDQVAAPARRARATARAAGPARLVHRGRAGRLAVPATPPIRIMSKRETHHFLAAPDDVTLRQAGLLVRVRACADGRAADRARRLAEHAATLLGRLVVLAGGGALLRPQSDRRSRR